MITTLLNQFKLDAVTVQRLSDVLVSATENGDNGVIDWVHVAMTCAVGGKLRDRDMNKLSQLEQVYARDFYKHTSDDFIGTNNIAYA